MKYGADRATMQLFIVWLLSCKMQFAHWAVIDLTFLTLHRQQTACLSPLYVSKSQNYGGTLRCAKLILLILVAFPSIRLCCRTSQLRLTPLLQHPTVGSYCEFIYSSTPKSLSKCMQLRRLLFNKAFNKTFPNFNLTLIFCDLFFFFFFFTHPRWSSGVVIVSTHAEYCAGL